MKNIKFSRRNLNFKIANLVLFSMILELVWFYRARLHMKIFDLLAENKRYSGRRTRILDTPHQYTPPLITPMFLVLLRSWNTGLHHRGLYYEKT